MNRIGYCFDCKLEIEPKYLTDSCPRCGGDNWVLSPKQKTLKDKQTPSKLTIELSNLGSESMRTVKRELKAIIEDYGYRKMISGSVKVTEGE